MLGHDPEISDKNKAMSEHNKQEISFDAKDILDHVRRTPFIDNGLSDLDKMETIGRHFEKIMKTMGMDLTNDSLKKTPSRLAKMYVTELFSGLSEENFPKITVIKNEMNYDEMIVVKDIDIFSVCEHHFSTIHGKAHVAYIPKDRVIGLSKINRIAKYFSRRPQVQERLTKQVADCLEYVLETKNVAVMIDAVHHCVVSRGVQDINSSTLTSDLRGEFKDDSKTRSEFMAYIQSNSRR